MSKQRHVQQVASVQHAGRVLTVRLHLVLQDIEAALKHWAATFEISETELMDRIMAASTGKLTKPDPNVSEVGLAI